MNEDLAQQGRAVLARQPFSKPLGIELVTGVPEGVVMRLPIRDELTAALRLRPRRGRRLAGRPALTPLPAGASWAATS